MYATCRLEYRKERDSDIISHHAIIVLPSSVMGWGGRSLGDTKDNIDELVEWRGPSVRRPPTTTSMNECVDVIDHG